MVLVLVPRDGGYSHERDCSVQRHVIIRRVHNTLNLFRQVNVHGADITGHFLRPPSLALSHVNNNILAIAQSSPLDHNNPFHSSAIYLYYI